MNGVIDKIGDLSWLEDPSYNDMGWVVVGETDELTNQPKTTSKSELEWEKAKLFLKDSDWAVLSDVPMTKQQKINWLEYRQALREIKLQAGFPDNINWPKKPE